MLRGDQTCLGRCTDSADKLHELLSGNSLNASDSKEDYGPEPMADWSTACPNELRGEESIGEDGMVEDATA
jgi:hypothetical protein